MSRLSTPAAGLLLGFIVGVIDAAIVLINPDWSPTLPVADPGSAPAAIWVSVTLCGLAGAIFSARRLGRFRAIPLAFAGPGLLLAGRVAPAIHEATGLSSRATLAVVAALTLLLAAPLAFYDFGQTRRNGWYLAASVASMLAIAACGSPVGLLPVSSGGAVASSPRGARNILLIFLDTTRADDARAMPRLAAFSQRAATFENAWAPSPWTIPSHFAVLTGKELPLTSRQTKRQTYTHPSPLMPQHLRGRGYATGAVFANNLLARSNGFGAGFDHFRRSGGARVCASSLGSMAARLWQHDAPRIPWCSVLVASEVTALARTYFANARRPYFLALNYFDPHEPYYVEPHCREPGYRAVSRRARRSVTEATPAAPADPARAERVHAQYRSVLRCLDTSLGAIIEEAERHPHTVIAIVGDHGEQFGEHGLGGHGNSVYRQVLHVPLILRAPGLQPARIGEPVSITDLYGTLLALADPSRNRPAPLFEPRFRRPITAAYATSAGAGVAVIDRTYHFIRHADGREELYDYAADSAEMHPLADTTIRARLRPLAIKLSGSAGAEVDFRALGYLR